MKIYTSPYPPIHIYEESVVTFLFETNFLKFPPSSPAYIDAPTGQCITRGQFKSLSLEVGWGLREGISQLGGIPLSRGSTIMLFSPNTLIWPVIMLGCLAAGVKPALTNSAYTAREVEHQWKDSNAELVFAHSSVIPVVLEMFKSLGYDSVGVRKRVVVADWGVKERVYPDFIYLDDILGRGRLSREELFPGKQSHETALMCYSSGTTGNPKGVETMHCNLTSVLQVSQAAIVPALPSDSLLAALPFYHVYGAVNLIMYPFFVGVPIVIMTRYDPVESCKYIEKYGITIFFAVPPIHLAIARHPATEKYSVKTLRYLTSGAAPLSKSLSDAVRKRLEPLGSRPYIIQGYGSTETSPASHLMDCVGTNHITKSGSVGRLLPNLEARLVGENGDDVEVGQPGEIWIRGPIVMKGYFNNPVATKKALTEDGWYKTGDVALIDKEGYYYIVDRVKELIKYKGFQVPPAELEGVLLQHPDIADVAVIGIHSEDQATELPRAYVVHVKGRKSINVHEFGQEVQGWIKSRVANYKYLRGGVSVIDAIPKSAAGKILRRELQVIAKKELAESRVHAKL